MLNFVVPLGGQGAACALAYEHLETTMKMYGNPGPEAMVLYAPLDEGNSDVETAMSIRSLNETLTQHSSPNVTFTGPACKVQSMTQVFQNNFIFQPGSTLSLNSIVMGKPRETELLRLLFDDEQAQKDMTGGYYQDMNLGFTNASFLLQKCFEAPLHPYHEIVSAVATCPAGVDAAGNPQSVVRVIIPFSLSGGEGRATAAAFPKALMDCCIQALVNDPNNPKTLSEAKSHCEAHLSISMLLIGDIEGYPPNEHGQNGSDHLSALVQGAMKYFPEDAQKMCDYFYYSDLPGNRLIQAESNVDHGRQTKHAHAVQLIHYAMIRDYFEDAAILANHGPMAVRASTPVLVPAFASQMPPFAFNGANRFDWCTFGFFGPNATHNDSITKALASRLRFDLFYKYDIMERLPDNANYISEFTLLKEIYDNNAIKRSFITHRLAPTAEQKIELDHNVFYVAHCLQERENKFLTWITDIIFTGCDWSSFKANQTKTSLLNVDVYGTFLGSKNLNGYAGNREIPDILNELTQWSTLAGALDNPSANFKATPYDVYRMDLVGTPFDTVGENNFLDIMQQMYRELKV